MGGGGVTKKFPPMLGHATWHPNKTDKEKSSLEKAAWWTRVNFYFACYDYRANFRNFKANSFRGQHASKF